MTNKDIQTLKELRDAVYAHKKVVNASYRIGKDAAADRIFVAAINARQALSNVLDALEPVETLGDAIDLMDDHPKTMVYQSTVLEAARKYHKLTGGA